MEKSNKFGSVSTLSRGSAFNNGHGKGTASRFAPSPTSQRNPDGTITLPETLGPTQTGPISATGKGDSHAFSVNDVRQGAIADCYFLAAMMAVANENPELLEKAITKNDDGTYTVKLYVEKKTGWWIFKKKELKPVNVKIYPRFPEAASGNDSANPNANSLPGHAWNAKGDEVELWVRLVEKAYALINDSYENINGGYTTDALETLTGQKYSEKRMNNEESAKKQLIKMSEERIPSAVSSLNIDNVSEEASKFALNNSIVQPHAYAVIKATKDSIKVRNPHGQRDVAAGVIGARVVEPEMTWDIFFELFQRYSKKK